MNTFYKAVTADEVLIFRTKGEAERACVDENDYWIEFQGEESEHGYVYDVENDSTYAIDKI